MVVAAVQLWPHLKACESQTIIVEVAERSNALLTVHYLIRIVIPLIEKDWRHGDVYQKRLDKQALLCSIPTGTPLIERPQVHVIWLFERRDKSRQLFAIGL